MACDHVGPREIIEMAEERLRTDGREACDGMRFRWSENHEGFFVAAVTEIERRSGQWVVARLDRLKEPLHAGELGLREITG